MIKNFEMAHADEPKELIMATQRAIIGLLKTIISGIREDIKVQEKVSPPGLTWEQIDYLLDMAAKKEPEIIFQKESM